MRKLISILLLAALGLPLASPLFAATAKDESSLPACCRRSGKHHCMGIAEKNGNAWIESEFSAALEKCPYAPATIAVSHDSANGIAVESVIYAKLVSLTTVRPQPASKRRIPQDQSRGKRGPPTLISL